MTEENSTVCFCVQKTREDVKDYIRKAMTPETEITNTLIDMIHKSFSEDPLIGRCYCCLDELENMMIAYTNGEWH